MWALMQYTGSTDINFLIYSPLYQIPICFVSCLIAFVTSIFTRQHFNTPSSWTEAFVYTGLAAFIANLAGVLIFKGHYTTFHLFISLASIVTLFAGAWVYRFTWRKIGT
jgi:hypothetical protein